MVGKHLAAVVFFGAAAAGMAAAGAPADADQLGATQNQIGAVEAQVQAGAAQIHQLTTVFDQAEVQAAALDQQIVADRVEMGQLKTKVSSSESAIRQDALVSYTGGVLPSPGLPDSALTDPSVRAEYLQVAAGDINDAVDQYSVAREKLAAAEKALTQQQQASQAAASAAAQARQQAEVAAEGEQAQLDQLQARLDQLVEAAAVATQQPTSVPTQGLPVNSGLVTVVHAIVSPPPQSSGSAGGVWLELRQCESSDNYQANTGNGYYGAYQFSEQTWSGLGFPGRPDLEPSSMQDQAAQELQARNGWGQWPACSAALGLS